MAWLRGVVRIDGEAGDADELLVGPGVAEGLARRRTASRLRICRAFNSARAADAISKPMATASAVDRLRLVIAGPSVQRVESKSYAAAYRTAYNRATTYSRGFPPMKLVIHPPVEAARLETHPAAGPMKVVNAADEAEAIQAVADADAFFGKITPPLLAAARQLRWVQSATASLEHYVFPELVAHPCVLTNMRGLFSDVIADQVMGYVICFARNLHRYIRNQLAAPLGAGRRRGGARRPSPPARASSTPSTGPTCTWPTPRSASSAWAASARRSPGERLAFGMRVRGRRSGADSRRRGRANVWPPERLPDLLAASDFVVIAAPHTPRDGEAVPPAAVSAVW